MHTRPQGMWMSNTGCLLCARHVTYITSFIFTNNLHGWVLLMCMDFYPCEQPQAWPVHSVPHSIFTRTPCTSFPLLSSKCSPSLFPSPFSLSFLFIICSSVYTNIHAQKAMNQVAGRFTRKFIYWTQASSTLQMTRKKVWAASGVQDGFAKFTPGTWKCGLPIHGDSTDGDTWEFGWGWWWTSACVPRWEHIKMTIVTFWKKILFFFQLD